MSNTTDNRENLIDIQKEKGGLSGQPLAYLRI